MKVWEVALDSVVMSRVEKLDSKEACPGARLDVELTNSIELKLFVVLLEAAGITILRVPPVTSLTVAETLAPGLLNAALVETAEWASVYVPALEAEDVFMDGAECVSMVVLSDLTTVPILLPLGIILVAFPMTAVVAFVLVLMLVLELTLELMLGVELVFVAEIPVLTALKLDEELLLNVSFCVCARTGLTAVVAFLLVLGVKLELTLELMLGVELVFVAELPVLTALKLDEELLLNVSFCVCARTGLTAVVAFVPVLMLVLMLMLELMIGVELELPVLTALKLDEELLLNVSFCVCARTGLTAVVAFLLVLGVKLELTLELMLGVELGVELVFVAELPVLTALKLDEELLLNVPLCVCARTGLTAVVAFVPVLMLVLMLVLELTLELMLGVELGVELVFVAELPVVTALKVDEELLLNVSFCVCARTGLTAVVAFVPVLMLVLMLMLELTLELVLGVELELPVLTALKLDEELLLNVSFCVCARTGLTAVVAFLLVLGVKLELTLELMLGVELGVELVFVAELPVLTALRLDEELLLNVPLCVCARTGLTAVVAFVPVLMLVLMLVLELTLELMLGVELGVELVFVAELPVVTALKLDEELLLNVSFCVCARTGLTAVVAFLLVLGVKLELTLELMLGVELGVELVFVAELPVVTALKLDEELLLNVSFCVCARTGLTAVVAFLLVLGVKLELTLELMLGVELGVELVFVAELPVLTALKLDEELLLNVPLCVCARTGLTAVVAFVPVLMLVLMLVLELTLELMLGVELGVELVFVAELPVVTALKVDEELLLNVSFCVCARTGLTAVVAFVPVPMLVLMLMLELTLELVLGVELELVVVVVVVLELVVVVVVVLVLELELETDDELLLDVVP